MRVVKYIAALYRKRFFQVTAVTLAIILVSAAGVLYFEALRKDANIRSLWDGVWWAIVTMGTVGYGDKYPVSTGGRVVGLLLIFSGVGLMSLFTATIASLFVEKKIKEAKGLEAIREKDHLVICGWNQYTENVLLGLTTYGSIAVLPIVLISELSVDEIDALRLKYEKHNLRFLRGDYVQEDVLLRANIDKARFAILMADVSGNHLRDRVDERTTLAALTIKSIAPRVKTIAELVDGGNRPHLKRAHVDEIIVRGEHVGSLLADAVNSPGLPKMISSILALGDTDKLWRVEIPRSYIGRTFKELSDHYGNQQAILIGILREKKAMKIEDLLTDNTSAIDNFIKQKIQESQKRFAFDKEEASVTINPDRGYVIAADDFAVVLSKRIPRK
jgi:voltage-gated potassium channel